MSPFHDNVTPLPGPRGGWSAAASIQGTLALDISPELGPPWVPEVLPLEGADVVPVAASTRRDLQRWAMTFAQACVEVVGGDRPASQLVRWTVPSVHHELAYRAGVVARAGVHRAGQGRGRRPVVRPQVENVRTCFVTDDAVEICARVRYGARNRALAARLEVRAGRWQCVALEFG